MYDEPDADQTDYPSSEKHCMRNSNIVLKNQSLSEYSVNHVLPDGVLNFEKSFFLRDELVLFSGCFG